MTTVQKFSDLTTWQESHKVVLNIYELTRKFPKEELFCLTSQIRRSAISVTSNIAEGFGRNTFKDKVHFFYQARGSMTELRNQLIIAKDIRYISTLEYSKIEEMIDRSQRLLHGLITKTNSLTNRN